MGSSLLSLHAKARQALAAWLGQGWVQGHSPAGGTEPALPPLRWAQAGHSRPSASVWSRATGQSPSCVPMPALVFHSF